MIGFKNEFKEIAFSEEDGIGWHRCPPRFTPRQDDILLVAEELPLHPNAMICRALSSDYSCSGLSPEHMDGGDEVCWRSDTIRLVGASYSRRKRCCPPDPYGSD